ncbi:hypothetical protein [Pseudoalteromonas sp. OF7H-1]|uniref:hypothetical protein n=1 Tax=Pseudoalteromonas sp. OF7H-1 TaxID=2917755 RepID=UPI001EF57C55|nr:hypothetical protein [Pseudoalteromonas sp. OF7H-1]MCG7541838.1 hypothetical protein [Pseudoalteromonas sp. OF7H-1]
MRLLQHNLISFTIIASIVLHLLLGWYLQQSIYIPSKPEEIKAMKTYLVIEPDKPKMERIATPKITEDKPVEELKPTLPDDTVEVPKTAQAEPKKPTVESTTKHITKAAVVTQPKKLDHRKAISQFRQQLLERAPSDAVLSQSQEKPQRLTVPKTHQTTAASIQREQLESTPQYTVYRENGLCYAEVRPDPSIPTPEGLNKNWRTAPRPCDGGAIKKAYDAAMSKWLNKR